MDTLLGGCLRLCLLTLSLGSSFASAQQEAAQPSSPYRPVLDCCLQYLHDVLCQQCLEVGLFSA